MADDMSLLSILKSTFKPDEPRRSPHVEKLVETVLQGRPEQALQAAEEFRQRLQAARADAEGASGSDLTDAQRVIIERMLGAYAEEDQALMGLADAIRGSDTAAVHNAIDQIRRATSDLYRCSEAWQGRMDADEMEAGAGLVMAPPQYAIVEEACERVARGEMSMADWEVRVVALEEEITGALDTIRAGFAAMREAFEKDAEGARLAEEVEGGFQDSLDAIARMRRYPDDADVEHLNQGWTDLMSATVRVQRAMRSIATAAGEVTDSIVLDADD